MEALQKNLGVIGGAILAMLNALASIGVVLPQGADAEGVALVAELQRRVGEYRPAIMEWLFMTPKSQGNASLGDEAARSIP